jgi:hypothetical protein
MKLEGRTVKLALSVSLVFLSLGSACSSSKSGGSGTGGSSATGGSGTGGAGTGGAGTGGAGTGGAGGGGGAVVATCGPFANGGSPGGTGGTPATTMSFFVSSQKNVTADLGGLMGADMRCQMLAQAVGLGAKTWHAYLSVEHDAMNGNNPTNAKDRIGAGPWFNAKGIMVAATVAALHTRTGDPAVFLDEHGAMINGQWTGSMPPNEHDILTGSNADGTVAVGKTCGDWTSAQAAVTDGGVVDGGSLGVARVGHSDGFGGGCSTATTPNNFPSWNSAHDNGGCDNTAPKGGAGRIYCFATN